MGNDEYKAMNREEEILNASADTFISCGDEFAKVVQLFWMSAFIAGAQWADKHPAKVWHQASEEPAGRDWRILCEDESGNCWVASRRDAFTIGYNWQEFAEDEALTRWAYISELLPKGGEE